MLTKEQQKELAIRNLRALKIYEPYIENFINAGTVTEFENYAGFTIEKGSALDLKIKQLEEENDYLVYAVIHDVNSLGEFYSMLCIGNYDEAEESDYQVYPQDGWICVFSYTWNTTHEFCSEPGDLAVWSFGGGVKRLW